MEDTKSVKNYLPQVWGIHDVTCTGLGSIALRVSRVFALGCCSAHHLERKMDPALRVSRHFTVSSLQNVQSFTFKGSLSKAS
jgi:hypothetical protein